MEPEQPVVASPQTPLPPAEPTGPVPGSSKKKYIIAGAILLAIILIGTTVLISTHHKAPVATSGEVNLNHPEDHTDEAVVSVTNDGFVPATLTVKPDTEVFFDNNTTNTTENEGGSAARVVQSKAAKQQTTYFTSDPINNNSEYGYTFRTPGTFQFYDFDTPTHTLTVTVSK